MILSLFKKKRSPLYPLTWVTPRLAVGHAPMSYKELESIRDQGIKAIMNLGLELRELARFEEEQGFEVYFLPVEDQGFPDLSELEKALDWLDECVYLGKKVLIHCRFGIGRTGTVVYSYLLRKGLDARKAEKKMRGIRSQPTENPQKRFLHQYWKKEKPFKLSDEPSLIPQFEVELEPYFERTRQLLDRVEADIPDAAPRCGRDHSRCCLLSVHMTLAEAVYLQFGINTELSGSKRREVIRRARDIGESTGSGRSPSGIPCPLLHEDRCLVYRFRPAQCRVFDRERREVPADASSELKDLSNEILGIFLGEMSYRSAPSLDLPMVVSGKFVQSVFYLMSKST
ncbi:MAG: dual specificity protein phosphatase family protein [Desulfobacteraceae bacterium]